jgi:hypothetical protein
VDSSCYPKDNSLTGNDHITCRSAGYQREEPEGVLYREAPDDRPAPAGRLQEIKQHLRRRRHQPVAQTCEWLRSVVQGYFNYHAVPGNLDSLWTFRTRLTRLWRTQLLRRSQRHRCNWDQMNRLAARWLPAPRVLRPWPTQPCRQSSEVRAVCAKRRTYGSGAGRIAAIPVGGRPSDRGGPLGRSSTPLQGGALSSGRPDIEREYRL